jgi:hypothetical protein
MLIECNHCGAPLDVKTGEGVAKCTYCGTSSQVKALRTVAPVTPEGWKPPAQWTPPPNFAADSAKVLVYHAGTAARGVVRAVMLLVFVLAIVPVIGVAVTAAMVQSQTAPQVKESLSLVNDVLTTARGKLESATALAGASVGGGGFLKDTGPDRVVEHFRQALGGGKVRARRLVIHPSHASIIAQDPQRPDNLDTYTLRGSTVSAPKPERLTVEKGKLEAYLFDLDEVAFDKIGALAEATVSELAYDQGAVSHVIVERGLPFTKTVVIRIYVSGARDSGRIDYDKTGRVHKVYK